MPQIVLSTKDTFEAWRVKTNQIAQYVGDVATLQDQDGNPETSLVQAIQNLNNQNIAIAIALG